MDLNLLIENIRKLCLLKGVKPTVACIESGVGKDFIGKTVRGQIPSVEKVKMFADYLGVTTSELLGEEKPPVSEDNGRSTPAGGVSEETRFAMELLTRLNPENRDKAVDHLQYLIAKQAEAEGKK